MKTRGLAPVSESERPEASPAAQWLVELLSAPIKVGVER
jgi:hypothetical protein